MSLPSLAEIFKETCKTHESRPALTMRFRYRTRAWTYGDLFRYAKGVTHLLERRGIKKGDRVLLWSQNSPYWVAAYFGIILKGGVVVPIHKENTPQFIEKIAKQTSAKVLIKQIGLEPAASTRIKTLLLEEIEPSEDFFEAGTSEDDVALLMYTSGTTGDPKGVILTHKNMVSNLFTLSEIAREEGYFTASARYLSILPLSHIFEQMVGMLFPLWSGGHIIYAPNLASITILSLLNEYKITRIAVVPEFLSRIMRRIEETIGLHWYTIPLIKRKFGGHLEWIACGGAPLDQELEKKWARLRLDLLQGYGLTETSPIVSTNTPGKHRLGSAGKPAYGVRVKIAPDGEILVKGPNIFSGYFKDAEKTAESFDDDGWFLTDDIGKVDREGFLYIKGRKKYMIKGPVGQNVFPEDIEFELNKQPGVKDSAVVGMEKLGRMEIHAVLLLEENAPTPEEIVRETNKKLASFQEIRGVSVWPENDFPRSATRKVKKEEVLKWLHAKSEKGRAALLPAPRRDPLIRLLSEVTGTTPEKISNGTKIVPDLNLDSLGRVELVARIEDGFGISLQETNITQETTVGELRALIEKNGTPRHAMRFKDWPLSEAVLFFRSAFLRTLVFPFLRIFMRVEVHGAEHIEHLSLPAIFMSNHLSYYDSAALLFALPPRVRWRMAIAAARDVLYETYKKWAPLATLIFNPFPLPRKEGEPIVEGLDYAGHLLDKDFSILVFPEGQVNVSKQKILPLKRGAGLMATEMAVPVIPVRIEGIRDVIGPYDLFPRHQGRVIVSFGSPLTFKLTDSYTEATRKIEEALNRL